MQVIWIKQQIIDYGEEYNLIFYSVEGEKYTLGGLEYTLFICEGGLTTPIFFMDYFLYWTSFYPI